jgi:hypothetical protein
LLQLPHHDRVRLLPPRRRVPRRLARRDSLAPRQVQGLGQDRASSESS